MWMAWVFMTQTLFILYLQLWVLPRQKLYNSKAKKKLIGSTSLEGMPTTEFYKPAN